MLKEKTLAFFDAGYSLSSVIDRLLEGRCRSRVDMGIRLVRSALTMPDHSGHGIQTPISRTVNRGCIQVGGTIIAFRDWIPEGLLERKEHGVILDIDRASSDSLTDRCALTGTRRVQDFVSLIVTLRAAGKNAVIRQWLDSVA